MENSGSDNNNNESTSQEAAPNKGRFVEKEFNFTEDDVEVYYARNNYFRKKLTAQMKTKQLLKVLDVFFEGAILQKKVELTFEERELLKAMELTNYAAMELLALRLEDLDKKLIVKP